MRVKHSNETSWGPRRPQVGVSRLNNKLRNDFYNKYLNHLKIQKTLFHILYSRIIVRW
jgi:hypothetical protein